MKYGINYFYNSKQKENADELHCNFNQIGTMYDFIKKHPDKRYIINLKANNSLTEEDFNFLNKQLSFIKAIVQDNYSVKCTNTAVLISLLKNDINAYLDFFVGDWETLQDLADLGVSDIRIDGALGFSCKELKIIKQKYPKLTIRAIPFFSSSAAFYKYSDLKLNSELNANCFFIRPEDTDLYEDAIDIFDFSLIDNVDRTDVLFDIYKRKFYNYNLRLLINNLNIDVSNAFIKSEFAKQRLNCKQRCKTPGKKCNFCNTMLQLTNNLVKFMEKENN